MRKLIVLAAFAMLSMVVVIPSASANFNTNGQCEGTEVCLYHNDQSKIYDYDGVIWSPETWASGADWAFDTFKDEVGIVWNRGGEKGSRIWADSSHEGDCVEVGRGEGLWDMGDMENETNSASWVNNAQNGAQC